MPETLVATSGFPLRAGISAGSNQSSHANLGYVHMSILVLGAQQYSYKAVRVVSEFPTTQQVRRQCGDTVATLVDQPSPLPSVSTSVQLVLVIYSPRVSVRHYLILVDPTSRSPRDARHGSYASIEL